MVFLPGIPSTRRFAKAQNLQRNDVTRVSTNSVRLPPCQSVSLEATTVAAQGEGVEGEGEECGGELSFAQEEDVE